MPIFKKLKLGLEKTRRNITEKIDKMLISFGKLDDRLFEELEEILVEADIGVETSLKLIDALKTEIREKRITDAAEVKSLLKDNVRRLLTENAPDSSLVLETIPSVILVVGVNGVGKTTSIAKLAYLLKKKGKKIIVAAADTFRAAAVDQLQIWAERAGAEIIRHSEGSDPAAVVFDAIQAAKARHCDVLICDTAGRLHTKKNLMDELAKVSRIIDRELPGASRETLLVLDATNGQNAVSQAKTFSEKTTVSGIILAKLDGTAKGGIIIAISSMLRIPVKFIGIGESIDDIREFEPDEFVEALFE